MILPPTIKRGDCIGIFPSSGPVRDQEKVESGIRIVHELGFRTKMPRWPETDCDYLAAEDHVRAQLFHSMLADDDVSALLALRGGYGCLRMMEMIDFAEVNSHCKFIVGFSDVSTLLNAISARTGMVTVHGPVLSSLGDTDEVSVQSLGAMLCEGLPESILADSITILNNGASEGILRGGNLTTLIHLLGTPWDIEWNETILLLEDTGESIYRIDRMLSQLYYSGKLQQLAGILLGTFDTGDNRDENFLLQEKVWQRVLELTEDMDYPVWGGFPAGHLQKNVALPLGVTVTMDSLSARLLVRTT